MAEYQEPSTSESLAKMLSTHPVVVRQIMAGLREKGYVQSEKGHGGGWKLVCDPSQLTLRDIYTALGSPPLIAIGRETDVHGCPVEQAVSSALEQVLNDTEEFLLARLSDVTLADLNADVRDRLVVRSSRTQQEEKPHAF